MILPHGGPKYPEVHVPLAGEDGNIFAIGGRVGGALRRAGISRSEIDQFYHELGEADCYDTALRTVMAWVATDSAGSDES